MTASVLPDLVDAFRASADEVRGVPPVDATAVLAGLPPLVGRPDADTAAAVLHGLGIGGPGAGRGAGLPAELAPLMAAMETLPAAVAEALLVELLARLVE